VDSGGTEGNAALTSATAAALTVLLIAEGITILRMHSLATVHMFIGMVLIPPVVLKLGSTGYRFVRYYAGTVRYREKGPPPLPLRLLAPALVAATVVVFVSGVLLMVRGHKSGGLLLIHKASFIVWGAVFAIHFLWHLPEVWRAVQGDWTPGSREAVPGAGARALLVAASIGGGAALALALLSPIDRWG
jgi:hypothetical protein